MRSLKELFDYNTFPENVKNFFRFFRNIFEGGMAAEVSGHYGSISHYGINQNNRWPR